MQKQSITNLSPLQIEALFEAWGETRHRARVLSRAVFDEAVEGFDFISSLKPALRQRLAREFAIGRLTLAERLTAKDGTQKFLFALPDHLKIEAVLIPDVGRKAGKRSLCISSQVGCAMGCTFCLTGQSGLQRNLEAWEIVAQIHEVQRLIQDKITHVVFMGMGEPLHNYDNVLTAIRSLTSPYGARLPESRVTVSTSGLLPQLERLAHDTNVKLALTLSAADDEHRNALMPVNRKYPLSEIIACIKRLPLKKHREIFLEYVLLDGINDAPEHAALLAELLHGLPCKVNLIPFNEIPGQPYRRPTRERVFAFLKPLREAAVASSIRQTRGRDILAACGQLSDKKLAFGK